MSIDPVRTTTVVTVELVFETDGAPDVVDFASEVDDAIRAADLSAHMPSDARLVDFVLRGCEQ